MALVFTREYEMPLEVEVLKDALAFVRGISAWTEEVNNQLGIAEQALRAALKAAKEAQEIEQQRTIRP